MVSNEEALFLVTLLWAHARARPIASLYALRQTLQGADGALPAGV